MAHDQDAISRLPNKDSLVVQIINSVEPGSFHEDVPDTLRIYEADENKDGHGPLRSPSVEIRDITAGVLQDSKDSSSITDSESEQSQYKCDAEQPYHLFSLKQKWSVVIIIGLAGLFSGLSSNIYFPSLNQISQELHVSSNSVSLTITSYLVVQGISPVIWGAFSDALGRRPIYIASFSVYIVANIALSFSPSFAILLIFRGLQAAGSASTVSIVRNFSIAVGPVLGGVLGNYLGFRSIFIFLLILSSLVLVTIVGFLPETMRRLAGDGHLRQKGIYQPLMYKFVKEPSYISDPEEEAASAKKSISLATFVEPLRLLTQKEIILNLIYGGVIYAIWSMVTSSTTSLFQSNFGLDETLIGLAYLPNGLGTIIGSAIVGRQMTQDYKAAEAAYIVEKQLPAEYKVPAKDLPLDFPVEKARQRSLPLFTVLFVISTGLYGFSVSSHRLSARPGWIAVPLLLQFLIAASSNAVFAMNQTLISDLCPGKGAGGTAVNNLVRCGLGAIGVSFVERMIGAMGPGPAFLTLALITVACIPLAVVTWVWGMEWRAARAQRRAKQIEKV
ncbi:major facilitator superfamily transporter multidrug resistance [Grosmannia clavigera kw1407]|uniref:Major facilitator superfamily transporter multidrug resistance n=1 Tax=Grosmannia clavigera (strain kw1407 / UAMH 11150) TaxID=655863 RepID=F0XAX1_GROCL|nr:major facilitator superfamily transporter multidrug resistance [Grosmannia clavigera kw1407]EFX05151.1 major facilitator superfamily transporter multidrug resistance [Grosmannia clavigera kw1407]